MLRLLALVFALCTLSVSAQTRKQKREMARADEALIARLQQHIQILASDSLEGRRTGTAGEQKAMRYLIQQYQEMGVAAAGDDGYVQSFSIFEGRHYTNSTYLVIESDTLILGNEYFPLSFSHAGAFKGDPSIALRESDQPWFRDIQPWLEEIQKNPHGTDLSTLIRNEAKKAFQKKATALILFNSKNGQEVITYNPADTTQAAPIPIIYMTNNGYNKHLKDETATIEIIASIEMELKFRKGYNVLAQINNNATQTVVIGAHYDHLGYGEDKNSLDGTNGIHNGADDNASGTAAVLELARLLQKGPTNQNYILMHFSGEELGLLGSKYWIQNPTTQQPINYMINMDMIGRYDPVKKLTIGGYGTSPIWKEVLDKVAKRELAIQFDSTGSGPSDHASFYRNGTPVLFFFTGSHADYHKTTDDWEKIQYKAQKDIIRLIFDVISETSTRGKLPFTATREPQMGRSARFTVSLGVIPDYSFSGSGMKIEGVSPGKLAEQIGLKAGDVLIKLGNQSLVDVNSYMQALSQFKKGEQTKLVVLRGKEELVFDITF